MKAGARFFSSWCNSVILPCVRRACSPSLMLGFIWRAYIKGPCVFWCSVPLRVRMQHHALNPIGTGQSVVLCMHMYAYVCINLSPMVSLHQRWKEYDGAHRRKRNTKSVLALLRINSLNMYGISCRTSSERYRAKGSCLETLREPSQRVQCLHHCAWAMPSGWPRGEKLFMEMGLILWSQIVPPVWCKV